MKHTVLACCKYALFAAALLPILVIALAMIPLLSWPWRVGILLPFMVLVLWGVLEWLKKGLSKRSGRPDPLRQESVPPGGQSAEPAERHRIRDLRQSWRTALRTLRGSHLKKEGDPLHVLPWYLVLGASGSGKTSAVRGARLLSPFAEGEGEAAATANCDWHFYDQGIVIDTAGRYAVPLEPASDHDEWRTFLSLLKKYRGNESINGVIAVVAADRLAGGDPRELEDQGRQLRCRIDEMIRFLGINFPVYLLITKCDLIGGMSEFCAELPPESLDQPMGLLNREQEPDAPRLLDRLSASLDGRLGVLRLLLLHRGPSRAQTGRLLLFPDRLRALRPDLDLFMQAAFAPNHYQETPLLRGIYLCSARREASTPAPMREAAGTPGERPTAATTRGMFLHDFFEKVLPGDRGLWTPSARTLQWRRLADNLALICWLLLASALCVLLSCSFANNMRVVREAAAVAASTPQPQGDLAANLAAMEKMRRAILELELKDRNRWLPGFGLTRGEEVQQALKRRYCEEYREHLLAPFDAEMAAALAALSPALPDAAFGRLVLQLSRRCNLLKARRAGADFAALSARPVPQYRVPASRPNGWSDLVSGNLYLCYVAWHRDADELSRELQRLQLLLKRLVLLKGGDLGWVPGYLDREEAVPAISLREFWGGSRPLPGEPSLAPSFTRRGRERLVSLLEEICAAYPDRGALERERGELLRRHRGATLLAWQRFAARLPTGERRLIAPGEWRSAAAGMAGERGAYLGFMRRAVSELGPFDAAEPMPAWIAELYRFQALKGVAPAGVASSLSGQAGRVAGTLGRFGDKNGGVPGCEPGADLVREYLNAVAQLAPVAKSRSLAHRMALQAFGDPGEAGKSPLFQAAEAAQRLNRLLVQGEGDDTFARLVYGPITFYGTYTRMETACALQAQWEEKVLKDVQGKSDPQTLQYLLGKDGPVWKYVADYADPFVGWSPARGYYPKSALGGAIPLKREFYSFLARGGKAKLAAAAAAPKPVYQVTIKGLPTDANAEARIKPQGTRLELHCATGPQVIANMNYPVSKPFIWTPDACSDVVFQIEVGDTVLTRSYPGSRGFADFLRDFPAGRHTFHPGDFPREKEALERMGIRFIRVNYRMFGAGDIASQQAQQSLPARIPLKIAECWDQGEP